MHEGLGTRVMMCFVSHEARIAVYASYNTRMQHIMCNNNSISTKLSAVKQLVEN